MPWERMLGSESAQAAAAQAKRRGWPAAEVLGRLADAGAVAQSSLGARPAEERVYLETWVRLAEMVRRHERLAARQQELETAEATLDAEAEALAQDGQSAIPAGELDWALRVALDEEGPEPAPVVTERTQRYWGLAAFALEEELAANPGEHWAWALRLAAHALGSRLASLHYKVFTLDHDNLVLKMHLGALTSRLAHLRADRCRLAQ